MAQRRRLAVCVPREACDQSPSQRHSRCQAPSVARPALDRGLQLKRHAPSPRPSPTKRGDAGAPPPCRSERRRDILAGVRRGTQRKASHPRGDATQRAAHLRPLCSRVEPRPSGPSHNTRLRPHQRDHALRRRPAARGAQPCRATHGLDRGPCSIPHEPTQRLAVGLERSGVGEHEAHKADRLQLSRHRQHRTEGDASRGFDRVAEGTRRNRGERDRL